MAKEPFIQQLGEQPYRAPRIRTRSSDWRLSPGQLEAMGFRQHYKKGPYSGWRRPEDFTFITQQIEILAVGTVFSEVTKVEAEEEEIICFRGWPTSLEDVEQIMRMIKWHPGPKP